MRSQMGLDPDTCDPEILKTLREKFSGRNDSNQQKEEPPKEKRSLSKKLK